MKKLFLSLLVATAALAISGLQNTAAQNTSPFWSLAGNNNASAASSKLGTTNNIPVRLFTNNGERIRISPAGNVGINNTSTPGRLTVQNAGGTPSGSWLTTSQPLFVGYAEGGAGNGDYLLSMASNSAVRSVLIGRRSRGTLAAPTAVANNDFLFSFLASGHDGSSFQNPATIDMFVDGAVSGGNVPARISFVTGSNSSNRLERMVVKSNGHVGIGTTTPERTLHVFDGSAGTVTSNIQAPLVVENNTNTYINVLAPTAGESGILFGNPEAGAQDGAIVYSNTADNMEFRTAANVTKMTLNASGDLSIGNPASENYKLRVTHNFLGFNIQSAGDLTNHWEQFVSGSLQLYANSASNFVGSFDPTNGVYTPISDERLKTNIKPMTSMLDKIRQLKPATYTFKKDQSNKEYNGFIAQEVMKVFPSLVYHNVNAKRNLDVYTMDYAGFGVLAVKGIQELEVVIKNQQQQIDELKELVNKLVNGQAVKTVNGTASVSQNMPNPVRNQTRISYSLPTANSRGQLLVTDASGRTIKTVALNSSGYVDLNTADFASGTYHYSLMVDGKFVETKKMTVTR